MRRTGGQTDRRTAKLALVLLLVAAVPMAAQQVPARDTVRADTVRALVDTAQVLDTLIAGRRARADSVRPRPPISPGIAFLRSLAIPGWGQASLNRNVTGGIFVAFEGIAITMVWKAGWQLDFARVRGKHVDSHVQEQQDWVVLLIFNHVLSATEAFVSAHLYDFPAALRAQQMPDGSTGVGVRVDF